MLQRTFFNKAVLQALRCSRINRFSSSSLEKNCTALEEKTTNEILNDEGKCLPVNDEVSKLLKESATYSDAKDKSWATMPYPDGAPTSVEQQESLKPGINPNDTSVVIFPGQGTLKVGDIEKYLKFPGVRDMFEIANEMLGYNLLKLCLKGPQEKLNETKYNQIATVLSSLSGLEQLREERPKVFETCVATAGYSIGELTALIFAGAFSLEDGIRLVAARGAAMQYASEQVPQGMMSVYCNPKSQLTKALKEAENWAQDVGVSAPVCRVAIYLYTQGKILGGNNQSLQYIENNSKSIGLSKLKRLPVSGAFHTPLMAPALKSFAKMLHEVKIEEPRTIVYSNYTGEPYRGANAIPNRLMKQIVSPVKWEQSMQAIFRRPPGTPFPRTFDVGSGGRMKTILKLINAKACDYCIVV